MIKMLQCQIYRSRYCHHRSICALTWPSQGKRKYRRDDHHTVRNTSSHSSKAWLDRQLKDPYVQKAQDIGVPSRAYFKLQEINEKLFYPAVSKKGKNISYRQLIKPNMLVLDLGAAPGGWSVYASSQLKHMLGGAVVSVDLHPFNPDVANAIYDEMDGNFEFIQGDFTKDNIRHKIMNAFARLSVDIESKHNIEKASDQRKANLIISDMAANFTGDSATDAIRTMNLCEYSLQFAAGEYCFDSSYSSHDDDGVLMKNGSFLCKYFSCGKEQERDLMDAAKRVFRSVHLLKPNASRKESSEMYLLGFNKK